MIAHAPAHIDHAKVRRLIIVTRLGVLVPGLAENFARCPGTACADKLLHGGQPTLECRPAARSRLSGARKCPCASSRPCSHRQGSARDLCRPCPLGAKGARAACQISRVRKTTQGLLDEQIAARSGIAEKTVKEHRARVMGRTGSAPLADLVRLATEYAGDTPFGTRWPRALRRLDQGPIAAD